MFDELLLLSLIGPQVKQRSEIQDDERDHARNDKRGGEPGKCGATGEGANRRERARAKTASNRGTAIAMGLFHVGAVAALFFFTWPAFLVAIFLMVGIRAVSASAWLIIAC